MPPLWENELKMMNKLKTWLIMPSILAVVSSAQAFTDDEHGYSIEIDDSYLVSRNNDVTFFESSDSDTIVIIKNWPGLTEEAAKEYLLQGYQDEILAIVATSDSEEKNVENGKGQLVDVLGVFERKLMKGLAGGFIGNNGQGMVMLVSTAEKDWDTFMAEAEKIAASVKFIEYSAGPDARDWYYMLSGARLSLRGSSDDARHRADLYLCSDGSFQHRRSESTMKESDSGSAFGYSTKTRSGSWQVVDGDGKTNLSLLYNDGRDESAVIEDKNGQTFLDGKRYSMMRNNRCR